MSSFNTSNSFVKFIALLFFRRKAKHFDYHTTFVEKTRERIKRTKRVPDNNEDVNGNNADDRGRLEEWREMERKWARMRGPLRTEGSSSKHTFPDQREESKGADVVHDVRSPTSESDAKRDASHQEIRQHYPYSERLLGFSCVDEDLERNEGDDCTIEGERKKEVQREEFPFQQDEEEQEYITTICSFPLTNEEERVSDPDKNLLELVEPGLRLRNPNFLLHRVVISHIDELALNEPIFPELGWIPPLSTAQLQENEEEESTTYLPFKLSWSPSLTESIISFDSFFSNNRRMSSTSVSVSSSSGVDSVPANLCPTWSNCSGKGVVASSSPSPSPFSQPASHFPDRVCPISITIQPPTPKSKLPKRTSSLQHASLRRPIFAPTLPPQVDQHSRSRSSLKRSTSERSTSASILGKESIETRQRLRALAYSKLSWPQSRPRAFSLSVEERDYC